jgi:hypothetical protein
VPPASPPPRSDTTGEQFAELAAEASDWADLAAGIALETWPDQ